MSKHKSKKNYDYLQPYADYLDENIDELKNRIAQEAEEMKKNSKDLIVNTIKETVISLLAHNYAVSPRQTVNDFLQFPVKSECMETRFASWWDFEPEIFRDVLWGTVDDEVYFMIDDIACKMVKEKFAYRLQDMELFRVKNMSKKQFSSTVYDDLQLFEMFDINDLLKDSGICDLPLSEVVDCNSKCKSPLCGFCGRVYPVKCREKKHLKPCVEYINENIAQLVEKINDVKEAEKEEIKQKVLWEIRRFLKMETNKKTSNSIFSDGKILPGKTVRDFLHSKYDSKAFFTYYNKPDWVINTYADYFEWFLFDERDDIVNSMIRNTLEKSFSVDLDADEMHYILTICHKSVCSICEQTRANELSDINEMLRFSGTGEMLLEDVLKYRPTE